MKAFILKNRKNLARKNFMAVALTIAMAAGGLSPAAFVTEVLAEETEARAEETEARADETEARADETEARAEEAPVELTAYMTQWNGTYQLTEKTTLTIEGLVNLMDDSTICVPFGHELIINGGIQSVNGPHTLTITGYDRYTRNGSRYYTRSTDTGSWITGSVSINGGIDQADLYLAGGSVSVFGTGTNKAFKNSRVRLWDGAEASTDVGNGKTVSVRYYVSGDEELIPENKTRFSEGEANELLSGRKLTPEILVDDWNILYDAMEDDGAARLIKDLGCNTGNRGNTLSVPDGKTFVLDLAGYKLDRQNSHTYIGTLSQTGHAVKVAGTLILNDKSEDKTGIITGGRINTDTEPGAGIFVDGGRFVMNGGSIQNNYARGIGGGGVGLKKGKFIMNGGEIYENDTDCKGAGVYVENGEFYMNGGVIRNNAMYENGGGEGVFVDKQQGSYFRMEGGEIKDNEGEGVYLCLNLANPFFLNGGSITGNGGAGVLLDNTDRILLSGNSVITGNCKSEDGKEKNIVLGRFAYNESLSDNSYKNGNQIDSHIKLVGRLREDAKIGVTLDDGFDSKWAENGLTRNSSVFTDGYNDWMGSVDPGNYFTSDDPGYYVTVSENGEAMLLASHPHVFTYTVDGGSVTAVCTSDIGDCNLPDRTAHLVINKPQHEEYGDGKEAAATLSGDIAAFGNPEIKYRKGTNELAGPPSNAGDYTAYITLGEGDGAVTASVDYTVSPREVKLDWRRTELTYNGDVQIPVGTVSPESLIGSDTCLVAITGAQKHVGKYTATAIALTNSNYKLPDDPTVEFTISKADIPGDTITAPTANTLTYTGLSQKLVSGGSVSGTTGTMKYCKVFVRDPGDTPVEPTSGSAYAESIPAARNAGKYYVWYKVFGDSDHNDTAAGYVTVDIGKASTDAPDAATRVYPYQEEVTDSVDLTSLLPKDAGNASFEITGKTGDGLYKADPTVSGNILSYTLNAGAGAKSGTITLKAQMQNYEDVTLTVKIEQTALALYEKTGKTTYAVRAAKKLNLGGSVTLVPRFADGAVSNNRVVWTSSNPDVATVTQDGRVTARSGGKTVITARSEYNPDLLATCHVTVAEPVTGITLDKKKYSFGIGEKTELTAQVLPFTGDQDLRWSTSNTAVAIVCDENGNELPGVETTKKNVTSKTYNVSSLQTVTVKAVGAGSAKVMATAVDGTGKKAVCTFTVGKPVPSFTIAGKGNKTSVPAGKTLGMIVNWGGKSLAPMNKGVKWSLSANSGVYTNAVATISSKGVLTGITAGKVYVTAISVADPSKKATTEVEITTPVLGKGAKVTGISFTNTKTLSDNGLVTGKSQTINTKFTLSGKGKAASNAVAWFSSDPSVATVTQKGKVTAVAPGRVTITAVKRDATDLETAPSAHISFDTYAKVKSVKLDKKKLTLGTQDGTQYGLVSIASMTPVNARDMSIKWTAANAKVKLAAIDADGQPSRGNFKEAGAGVTTNAGEALAVMGVEPGTVKLTGITNDGSRKKVSCVVTVRGQVTGLSLKTQNAKKGVNDVTVSSDSVSGNMVYTGKMKAGTSMKLTPVVDINGLTGTPATKADKAKYKIFKKVTDTSVSYRSSDTTVATVDKKGKITVKKGIAAGKTVAIYATSTDGNYKAQFTITVVN